VNVFADPTVRDFETVNRVKAKGGAKVGPGPVVVNGMLYVPSAGTGTGAETPGKYCLPLVSERLHGPR
jgi:hypothetical protein